MELSIPGSAKTSRDALKSRRGGPAPAPRIGSLDAPPRTQGFFRHAQPTTFQRCLAVHMHFAQHASALD